MKSESILITGGDGRLGGALIKELVRRGEYSIISVSLDKQMTYDMLERENITDRERIVAMDQKDFFQTDWSDLNVSTAIHMAFSRGNRPSCEIANSLDYSSDAYKRFGDMNVPRIIYMSSQSVYGKVSDWRTEELQPSPESIYSMAKYAGEKLMESRFKGRQDVQYTVLRLDYVIQSQNLISALCRDAKEKGVLSLKGGKQTFSYIDKTDVAKAIAHLLDYKGVWKSVYNVGPNRMRYTLMEIANVVVTVAKNHGYADVKINLTEDDSELWSGMDSSSFMKDTGWKPSMDIYQMVNEIFVSV